MRAYHPRVFNPTLVRLRLRERGEKDVIAPRFSIPRWFD